MTSDVHTLSGAYALNALTPEEAEEFARHLAVCEACRTEVAEFQRATAQMGAAEALTPPADLKERILAAIDRTPQLPPRPVQERSGQTQQRPAPARARDASTDASGSRRWLTWVATAAAAVVLIGIGVVGVRSAFGPDTPRLSTAATQVFTASDVHTATVSTTNGGKLRVGVSPTLGKMAVDTRDLPALDSGHVYQIWAVRGDTMSSAAVLADPQEGAAMGLPAPRTDVAVTVEPAGGSRQPTTKPIVEVDPHQL
jgi:anti-sigma factor RsiW